ncbi:MAG: hypothetical protein KIT34_12690 [Cyanobacteria bacterium TGS_CYA1]|nr:hypothetical protein [Cyanobacteria bacterium TGS_CYA1]
MKENIGLFLIAIIISSSCTYVARTMNNVQNAEIQTRNCDLDISEIDEIVLGHKPRNVPREIVSPPSSLYITGPYYYNDPLDLVYVSNPYLNAPTQTDKPQVEVTEEEFLKWATPLQ